MKNSKRNIFTAFGGLLVGLINGAFGAGGGMLVVPLFADIQKMSQKNSHATAVITMFPICLTSAIGYLASGIVKLQPLIYVMIGGVIGSALGTFFLCKIRNDFLVVIFYILMIFAGAFMILKQYNVV